MDMDEHGFFFASRWCGIYGLQKSAGLAQSRSLKLNFMKARPTSRRQFYSSSGLVSLAVVLAALSLPVRGASPFRFGDVTSPDFFPILPWDPQHGWSKEFKKGTNELESIAECHFNMAGFVRPEDLPRCKKLGLSAILLPTDATFKSFAFFQEWKKLSGAEIDRRVQQIVRGAGHNPAVTGFAALQKT